MNEGEEVREIEICTQKHFTLSTYSQRKVEWGVVEEKNVETFVKHVHSSLHFLIKLSEEFSLRTFPLNIIVIIIIIKCINSLRVKLDSFSSFVVTFQPNYIEQEPGMAFCPSQVLLSPESSILLCSFTLLELP